MRYYYFEIKKEEEKKEGYWAAPAVIRMNHHDGVAPYNGVVAVTQNSFLWKEGMGEGVKKEVVDEMKRECEEAAKVVDARAPIRVDCRINRRGKGILFDLSITFYYFTCLLFSSFHSLSSSLPSIFKMILKRYETQHDGTRKTKKRRPR